MSAQGYYGDEDFPFDLSVELAQLVPRQSDPNLDGPMLWFRSDQDDLSLDPSVWGEIRLYDGSTTTKIPVLESGSSHDGVAEALEFQTKHGVGYIPIASIGDVPEMEIQHSGEQWEWTDGQGPVVDSGDDKTVVASGDTIRANSVAVAGTMRVEGTLEVHPR